MAGRGGGGVQSDLRVSAVFSNSFSLKYSICKKPRNNKCWRGCGEKGTLLHWLWECNLIQPLRRTVYSSLKH